MSRRHEVEEGHVAAEHCDILALVPAHSVTYTSRGHVAR